VRDLSAALAASRPGLVGVYLHGSAVLGGFDPARSDVDVLAVVAGPGTADTRRAMGEVIVATAGRCPGAGLEMSVITAGTAASLGTCPFEVHVNTTPGGPGIVVGGKDSADPDLILHCAVCREHAHTAYGPPPGEVFGPVPRARVLDAMLGDLRWALDHASSAYAVLNACRALRYAEDERLCSKLEGAAWYLARQHPGDPVVTAAVAHQRDGGQAPPQAGEAARFVAAARARLRSAAGSR
jgi:streptomycin 3"-adenylyltransferase